MTYDPVCQMEVDEGDAAAVGMTSEFNGRIYCFCSSECKQQFDSKPEDYITPESWEEPEIRPPEDFA